MSGTHIATDKPSMVAAGVSKVNLGMQRKGVGTHEMGAYTLVILHVVPATLRKQRR